MSRKSREPRERHERHEPDSDQADKSRQDASAVRFRVRLPGFLVTQNTPLGDVIARATTTAGIRPCEGCHRRAAALNRWVAFVPSRPS